MRFKVNLGQGPPIEEPLQQTPAVRARLLRVTIAFIGAAACCLCMLPRYEDNAAWKTTLFRAQTQRGETPKQQEVRRQLDDLRLPQGLIDEIVGKVPDMSEKELGILSLRIQITDLQHRISRRGDHFAERHRQARLVREYYELTAADRKPTESVMATKNAMDQLLTLAQSPKRENLAAALHALQKDKAVVLWLVGGIIAAFVMTLPPDLHRFRFVQLVMVPTSLVAMHFLLLPIRAPATDVADFIMYLPFMFIMAAMLGPNIAYYCARIVQSTLDPQDWTPLNEELAIAPIQQLIREDRYTAALNQLEDLLGTRKATYESLFLKAKLLHHFCRNLEARRILLKTLRLAQTDQQQRAVMLALQELRAAL